MTRLRALGNDTEGQVRSLNVLAEHVSAKVKALEDQQSVVERALVESRRVHEMVWEMEAQIGKLNEGGKRTVRVEEMLARVDRTLAETTTRQEEAARAGKASATRSTGSSAKPRPRSRRCSSTSVS